jgi:hypothetical protein
VPSASGWIADSNADYVPDAYCDADADCGIGVCVQHNGGGWCAQTPPALGCTGSKTAQDMTKVESGTISVCKSDGYGCNGNLCQLPCTNDAKCWAEYSFEAIACTTDANCSGLTFAPGVCVDIGGGLGRCFTDADAAGSCTAGTSRSATKLVGGAAVNVCALDTLSCVSGSCGFAISTTPCTPPSTGCGGAYPDCVVDTCVCNGSSCGGTNDPQHPTCDSATGLCSCADASTCTVGTKVHPGTTWVCE